jgi:hypothetical protein
MGTLSESNLSSLVTGLVQKFNIGQFVETGTYVGGGAAWAAKVFPSVITIEINDTYRQLAIKNCGHVPSITFLLGDSVEVLPQVVADIKGPTFFWIDAHAGGGNFGAEEYCPLLAELEIIASSPYQHYIFIDDARAFLAPPPPPFKPDQWPELFDVLTMARKRHPYYCAVIQDIVMCVPRMAQPDIVSYCNRVRPKI